MTLTLTDRTEVKVRFGEVDSMGIVWHGNYVKYIEEGRESFGKKYGISYLDIYANDVMAPVVNMNIDFKKQVHRSGFFPISDAVTHFGFQGTHS